MLRWAVRGWVGIRGYFNIKYMSHRPAALKKVQPFFICSEQHYGSATSKPM